MHQKRKKHVLEAGTADDHTFKCSIRHAPGSQEDSANILPSKQMALVPTLPNICSPSWTSVTAAAAWSLTSATPPPLTI